MNDMLGIALAISRMIAVSDVRLYIQFLWEIRKDLKVQKLDNQICSSPEYKVATYERVDRFHYFPYKLRVATKHVTISKTTGKHIANLVE